MTIQIQQTFPHCERCGIMLHTRRARIAARAADGRSLVFCSDLCRDEYAELYGLAERGDWVEGSALQRAGREARRA